MEWDINGVVAESRAQRMASALSHVGQRPCRKLPSPNIVARLLEHSTSALIPPHVGNRVPSEESVDGFVGDSIQRPLHDRSVLHRIEVEPSTSVPGSYMVIGIIRSPRDAEPLVY